jgi:uncharacterized protein YciI
MEGGLVQYAVIAWDGTDPEAPSRRHEARPTHLDSIQPLVEAGNVLVGGAILDADGGMIGSVLIVDFEAREELDSWIAEDPYTTRGVWESVDVRPFRAAVGSWMPDS